MLGALFSFRGRLNRLQYFLSCMALGVTIAALAVTALAAIGLHPDASALPRLGMMALLALAAVPVLIWVGLALQARRLRDMGWNPAFVIPGVMALLAADRLLAWAAPALSLAPLHTGTVFGLAVNLLMSCFLLFWPGKGPDAAAPQEDADLPEPAAPAPTTTAAARTTEPAPMRPAPARSLEPTPARTTFGRRSVPPMAPRPAR